MAKGRAAKTKLLAYFVANVGKVVGKKELQEVAGISEWARRVRELRVEDGYPILSHNDRAGLRPGQYILTSKNPSPTFGRGVTAPQRARILLRNGYTCQVCGSGAGDPHPLDPTKKLRLHIDHVVPVSKGGTDDDSNLRVLCSACNEGRKDLEVPVPKQMLNVLQSVRIAARDVQLEVLKKLAEKFGVRLEWPEAGS
jgi:hypothetical protein